MSFWSQVLLQDSCSPSMQFLSLFHDYSLAIITMILFFVAVVFTSVVVNTLISDSILVVAVEVIWTILPVFILLFLVVPSLKILYLMEESDAFLAIKVIGRQWYWSYEYLDSDLMFDSYMMPENPTTYRLLDVDHRVIIPSTKNIRALVTGADVIHCWTMPALGFKADAVPGRLNQVNFNILKPSILYGQCSEICGANHSFMPICLESIKVKEFLKWVNMFWAS